MEPTPRINLSIRAYHSDDRPACLALFDSNAPKYFALVEKKFLFCADTNLGFGLASFHPMVSTS